MYLEVTAPLGAMGVDRTSLPPGAKLEFERIASVLGQCTPSFRISGPRIDDVIADFRGSPYVTDVSLFSESPERSVYRLTWSDIRPTLVEQVHEADGSILSAAAAGETWTLELRFLSQAAATDFYTQYDDSDYSIVVKKTRQNESFEATPRDVLTVEQREALVRAIDAGYFNVPRRTTLVELANEMDISDSAVSQRLRRGILNILRDGTSPPIAISQSVFDESR